MIKVTFKEPTVILIPTDPNEPQAENIICIFILCHELTIINNYYPAERIVQYDKNVVINAGNLDKIKSIEHVKPTDL